MTITLPKIEKATRPAKAWRNKYRVFERIDYSDETVDFPGISWAVFVWPSKEIAEEQAADWMSDPIGGHGCAIEYLGAFPVTQ